VNKETFKFLCSIEVFLLSPDEKEVLLIHRSKDKEFLPDLYAGIGGKMDSKKIETPLTAAYREIEEESFYKPEEIINMHMKGMITVFDRWGKWNVFDFLGKVKTKHFEHKKEVEEGTLEWVSFDRIPELKLIEDLQKGTLEKILFSDQFIFMQSVYNQEDHLVDFQLNEGCQLIK
jgi:8-oxo-dGTP pyrophosphatase MutT (NUDIX family)